MNTSLSNVSKRLVLLNKMKRKEYSLERTFSGGYHLMCGTKFIVTDQPLQIVNIVINAMIQDRRKLSKSTCNVCESTL